MNDFLQIGLTDYGPWFLFGISGYVVAWFVYRDHVKLQTSYSELLERVIAISTEQNESLNKVVEGLEVQKLLADHFDLMRGKQK